MALWRNVQSLTGAAGADQATAVFDIMAYRYYCVYKSIYIYYHTEIGGWQTGAL